MECSFAHRFRGALYCLQLNDSSHTESERGVVVEMDSYEQSVRTTRSIRISVRRALEPLHKFQAWAPTAASVS